MMRWMVHYNYVYFFFFQAEDGIRDTSVTGVQTCALPISRRSRRWSLGTSVWIAVLTVVLSLAVAVPAGYALARLRLRWRGLRSEERRVGKECRARGWPGHRKEDWAAMGEDELRDQMQVTE